MADSKKLRFSSLTKLNIFSQKFQGLVLRISSIDFQKKSFLSHPNENQLARIC